MNQPQRWRGSPSSPLGAVIFVGMLLALLLNGCVHVAMLGMMTNVAQMHQIGKLEKRMTAIEVRSGQSVDAVQR